MKSWLWGAVNIFSYMIYQEDRFQIHSGRFLWLSNFAIAYMGSIKKIDFEHT